MTHPYKPTDRQKQAVRLIAGEATYIMLFGGSRSGKTFILVRCLILRALKAANSRHAVLRFRFNAVKASVVHDTFPKVMDICFPGVKWELNKTDWYVQFENGSQVWFGGLDDKERTEKILGQEFATIYLNECSQIPWSSVGIAFTRLAQKCTQEVDGVRSDLSLRMFFDCNPPDKGHWTYKVFVLKQDPESKLPLMNDTAYAAMQMNPRDNADNLPESYIKTLEGLSARLRRRFLDGEFKDANPNALFNEQEIDKWRVLDGKVPDMQRIVVAVDPSGAGDTDNADNDAIGIVVAGLGTDGNAYILEDLTVKAGPGTWGRIAVEAFDRHSADAVVGETNFGGEMVHYVIQTQRQRTNFKKVTASRGKVVRAEPFSPLYEQGKVRHVGYLAELEEELSGFSTAGYTGEGSPNRADALIWALAELFPSIVRPKKDRKEKKQGDGLGYIPQIGGWMGA